MFDQILMCVKSWLKNLSVYDRIYYGRHELTELTQYGNALQDVGADIETDVENGSVAQLYANPLKAYGDFLRAAGTGSDEAEAVKHYLYAVRELLAIATMYDWPISKLYAELHATELSEDEVDLANILKVHFHGREAAINRNLKQD